MSLIPQYFEIREVGKTIKSTKKQYVWRFKLDNKDHTIELFTSVLSGKKKILQNGTVIFFDSKFKNAFQFPFNIGKNALNIIQHGDKFELRINNMSFSHLWENERTKRNFNFGDKQAHDPYQAKDYAQNYNTSTKPTSRDQQMAMSKGNYLGVERNDKQNHGLTYSNSSDLGHNRNQAQPKKEKKRADDWQVPTYDYSTGFDHGFGKFDTNVQGGGQSSNQQKQRQSKSGVRKQDTSEFFGDEEFKKNEQQNQFDFNFGGSYEQKPQPQPQKKKEEPKQQDLFDLLGGSPQNNPQPAQAQGTNALDFFNDLNFNQPVSQQEEPKQEQKQPDMLGATNSVQQAQNTGSIFDVAPIQESKSVDQAKAEQPAQQEAAKPKFVPNLGSFFTNQNDPYAYQQQQQMQQQQMYMQQMMMQQQMMQGMNTNNFGGMGGQPQMQMNNQFMTNQMQGNPNQQQMMYNQQQPNQQQQYQQQQQQQPQYQQQQQQDSSGYGNNNNASQNQASTPFDIFS